MYESELDEVSPSPEGSPSVEDRSRLDMGSGRLF